MSIAFLRHNEIDQRKWDSCIYRSLNGSIYAFSWYLDVFGSSWHALVEDDYISVMPLFSGKIFRKEIIYTPDAARELGIFSRMPVTAEKTGIFLSSLPAEYSWYRVALNKFNPVESSLINIKKELRFSLDLIRPYYRISQNFTPEMQNLLHRAVTGQPELSKGISPNDLISFIKKRGVIVDRSLKMNDFRILRAIMAGLIRTNSGELYGIYDTDHKLTSVGILAWLKNRLFLIFLAVNPHQGILNPHLFLIDRIIDKYSETNSILNFDYLSSQITNEIYGSFGAVESAITFVTGGKLPSYAKFLIRAHV